MPNYLSYNSSQAWKDIHGYRSGKQGSFDKDPAFFLLHPDAAAHIVGSSYSIS
jgi:hypothetical protein